MPPVDGKYEEIRYTREAKQCAVKAHEELTS